MSECHFVKSECHLISESVATATIPSVKLEQDYTGKDAMTSVPLFDFSPVLDSRTSQFKSALVEEVPADDARLKGRHKKVPNGENLNY